MSQESIGTPAATVGSISILPLSISSEETIGTPTAILNVTAVSVQSIESIGTPTISVGAVDPDTKRIITDKIKVYLDKEKIEYRENLS